MLSAARPGVRNNDLLPSYYPKTITSAIAQNTTAVFSSAFLSPTTNTWSRRHSWTAVSSAVRMAGATPTQASSPDIVNVGVTTQDVRAYVKPGNGGGVRIFSRFHDDNNCYFIEATVTSVNFVRRQAGIDTVLNSGWIAPVSSGSTTTYRVKWTSATNYELWADYLFVTSGSDSAGPAGTAAGVSTYELGGDTTAAVYGIQFSNTLSPPTTLSAGGSGTYNLLDHFSYDASSVDMQATFNLASRVDDSGGVQHWGIFLARSKMVGYGASGAGLQAANTNAADYAVADPIAGGQSVLTGGGTRADGNRNYTVRLQGTSLYLTADGTNVSTNTPITGTFADGARDFDTSKFFGFYLLDLWVVSNIVVGAYP
ncbi:MAG TPA: hypothetical protein VG604_02430 [Candidatus Saccharimonadales bacterium]|nr:hypothetical protein [Candidatus Saccharimonadales bacterium]